MRVKLLCSLIIGMIGGMLIPVCFYLLFWLGMGLYTNESWIGRSMAGAPDGIMFWIFAIWIVIIIPLILLCAGFLSLVAGSKHRLSGLDYIILPELSGIVAIMLGYVLFFSITPASISLDWVARMSWGLYDMIFYLIVVALLLALAQCAIIGTALFSLAIRPIRRDG